jgi:hypothetical protein
VTVRDDDLNMQDYVWADRLFAGEPVEDDGGLSGVIAAVLATADRPAPTPNAALATILRDGLPPVPECATARRTPPRRPAALREWSSRTVRVAAAALAATAAMGAGVATAEVSGVSTLDYVPEPVKRGVDAAVSAVADVFTGDSPSRAPAVDGDPAPAGPAKPADSAPVTTEAPPAEPVSSPLPEPSLSAVPTPSASPVPEPDPTVAVAPTVLSETVAPSAPAVAEPSQEPSASPSPSPAPSTGSERKPLEEQPSPSPTAEPSPEPSAEPSGEPSGEPGSDAGEQPEPTAEPTGEASPEPASELRWERPEGPRRAETGPS